MKNQFKNLRLVACLLLAITFSLSSCDDDDDVAKNLVSFDNIMIQGSQEVPAVTTQAMGHFSGTYNKDTKILMYVVEYEGITPTAMHFHKGETGKSGGVEIGIGSAPFSSPITGETPALTAEQETELLAGRWYINIHSSMHPAGEIRGQLLP